METDPQKEAEAAAAEAARIGGDVEPLADDPAAEPVLEGGGGEAEGFEQAEAKLKENAEHGEGAPLADRIDEDAEAQRSGAAFGEPDRIQPSDE